MRRLSWISGFVLCGFLFTVAGCTSNDSSTKSVGEPGKPKEAKITLPEKGKVKAAEEEQDKDKDKDKKQK